MLCDLRKNKELMKKYHFEGRVTCCKQYYASRNMSYATTNSIIEDCAARHDGCMNKYVSNGSWIERQNVCITKSDIHHHTCHCISLYCIHLSLWTSKCLSLELIINWWLVCLLWGNVIAEVLLLSYVLCTLWTIRLDWFYVGCSCGN